MDLKELHQAEGKTGQRLRKLRRDLTQEELAALAGTNQAVIQKIENGKSKRPRILAELAIVLWGSGGLGVWFGSGDSLFISHPGAPDLAFCE